MAYPPETWKAALCVDSPNISKAMRLALDELGWEYERERSNHHFTRLMVFITMPQNSYVFRFNVNSPARIVIDCYDERPTHVGEIHYMEIRGLDRKNARSVRELLQTFANKLGRRPYDFHWKERVRSGLLSRPHLEARREWSRWGI